MKTVQEIAAEIAQELTEHPDRWTQGTYARDEKGRECSTADGVCWCILGWLSRKVECGGILWESFSSAAGFENTQELLHWNDAPLRTVDEVVDLCQQVASK